MAESLERLIAQYRWLQKQDSAGELISTSKRRQTVAEAKDAVFLEIVSYPSTDPRLCYSQIAFLLDALANDRESNPECRSGLRDLVLVHVKRLTDRLESQRPTRNRRPHNRLQ